MFYKHPFQHQVNYVLHFSVTSQVSLWLDQGFSVKCSGFNTKCISAQSIWLRKGTNTFHNKTNTFHKETLTKSYWNLDNMSHVTRKPVFGVCDQLRLKPACSADETSWGLEISAIASRGIILSRQQTTIQAANNKGTDQTARMRRLICTFVVRIWHKTGFLMMRLISYSNNLT